MTYVGVFVSDVTPVHPAPRRRSRLLVATLGAVALIGTLFQPITTTEASAQTWFLDPVVAYDFEDNVNDVSGNNNHGSWAQNTQNPATYVEGVSGKAMKFQNGRSFVSLPAHVQPTSRGMSVAMWYKEVEYSTDGAIFGNLNFNSRSNPGFLLGHTTSVPSIVAVAGGDGIPLEVIPASQTSEWTHVVVTLDGSNNMMRVYLNGELTQTRAYSTGKPLATSHPFRIGTDGFNVTFNTWINSWATGYVDTFRFFDGPISAEQVRAEYSFNEVTVTADANGTASASPESAAPGHTVTLTATANEGYHFDRWEAPADVTITGNTFVMPEGPVTVHARFAANEYEVNYDGNGADGGATAASSHTYDASAPLTANGFTREGYRFVGWATTTDGAVAYTDTASVENLTAVQDGSVTLYAVWVLESEQSITVLSSTNGTVTVVGSAEPGDTITPVATPDEGHHFVGWLITPEVTFTDDSFTMPADDVVLSAVFAANTYTVMYDGNGADGGSTAQTVHTYNVEAPLATNGFTREDRQSFTGWNTAVDGSGTSYANAEAVHNLTSENGAVVTLYAQWKVRSVTFGANADIHNNWNGLRDTLHFWQDMGVEAGLLVGDLTNNGTNSEVQGLLNTLANYRGDLNVISSRGNHDGAVTDAAWRNATGNERSEEVVIDGYHFLVIECTGAQTYTAATKTFLEERLAAITAEDPNNPIFVLAHCPLPLTVYASVLQGGGYYGSGLGQGNTSSVFDDYPQAVVFSGHIHYPNRIPTAIWQDKGWTAMNVPSENNSYYGELPGGQGGVHLSGTVDIQTTIVEVVDTVVTVKQYNLANGQQDGPTWEWDVADTNDRPYTDDRANQTQRAVWPEDATGSVSSVTNTSVTAHYPTATIPGENLVEDIVHHYNWYVTRQGSSTTVTNTWQSSEWYRHTPPTGQRSVNVTGLQACTDYTFNVNAANAWHQNSVPFSFDFFTAGNCAVTVEVADDANGTATADRPNATEGTQVTLTATPDVGYRLVSWESDRDVEVVDGRFTMPAGPITVTPVFAPIDYTVSFDANGGSGTQPSVEFSYDDESALPASTLTRAGYEFVGWATAPDGDVEYTDGATVLNLSTEHGATVTLYAVWEQITVEPEDEAPVVTVSPVDVTVDSGDSAVFTVNVTGTPEPTVTWEVSTDGGETWVTVTSGVSTDGLTLTVPTTDGDDGNQYLAVANNGVGDAAVSTVATLTVTPASGDGTGDGDGDGDGTGGSGDTDGADGTDSTSGSDDTDEASDDDLSKTGGMSTWMLTMTGVFALLIGGGLITVVAIARRRLA